MDLDTYISTLQAEGQLFGAAISASNPDANVPTCPAWTMRNLVHHQGEVHRWATTIVRDAIAKPSAVPADFLGPLPADDDLLEWFVEGHSMLVETLQHADPDVVAFTFLADPPSPLTFWARRQLHETGVHRIDAQSATDNITDFAAPFAADGIDEMLTGFAPRKHTPLHSDPPVTLQVSPSDHDSRWHLTISDAPPATVRTTAAADCTIAGSSSDLFRALWNRGGTEELQIDGDACVLAMFRDNVKIRWS